VDLPPHFIFRPRASEDVRFKGIEQATSYASIMDRSLAWFRYNPESDVISTTSDDPSKVLEAVVASMMYENGRSASSYPDGLKDAKHITQMGLADPSTCFEMVSRGRVSDYTTRNSQDYAQVVISLTSLPDPLSQGLDVRL
jgi:hypothetical protein